MAILDSKTSRRRTLCALASVVASALYPGASEAQPLERFAAVCLKVLGPTAEVLTEKNRDIWQRQIDPQKRLHVRRGKQTLHIKTEEFRDLSDDDFAALLRCAAQESGIPVVG